MGTTLADRIKSRLDAVGKSAAAVSIEAGLGRSAVQNILRGASESPRLMTLQKLAGPLECSLEYLAGQSESPDLPRRTGRRRTALAINIPVAAANVFRTEDQTEINPDVHQFSFADPAFPGWRPWPVRVADDSMINLGVRSGDLVTAMMPDEPDVEIELQEGSLVFVRRTIAGRDLTELSLRLVELGDGKIRLHLMDDSETEAGSIIIPLDRSEASTSPQTNVYEMAEGDTVEILGVITSLFREIKTPR